MAKFKFDRGTVEFYKDEAGEARCRVTHENGNILMATTESYKNLDDCLAGVFRAALLLEQWMAFRFIQNTSLQELFADGEMGTTDVEG